MHTDKPLFGDKASTDAAMEAMSNQHHGISIWRWLGGAVLLVFLILLVLGLRNPDMRTEKPFEPPPSMPDGGLG